MNARAVERRIPEARRWSARPARAVVLGALVLASVSLSGCSLKVLSQHLLPVSGPKLPDSGDPGNITEARERIATFPAGPYWRYRIAQLYVEADSLPAAESALQASLARDATYAPALALLSKLYYQSGRHEEGVRLLEIARARPDAFTNEDRQALMAGMALHLDALGRPDLAEAIIPRGDDADLKRTGAAMVYVSLRGDRPDSVADLARETLDRNSHSAVNLNNYGITRLRAADPKSARKAFLEAIERDPGLAGPYYNLAILEKYYMIDDEAATRWFHEYWKRSHEDPDSLVGVFANDAPKNVAQKGR